MQGKATRPSRPFPEESYEREIRADPSLSTGTNGPVPLLGITQREPRAGHHHLAATGVHRSQQLHQGGRPYSAVRRGCARAARHCGLPRLYRSFEELGRTGARGGPVRFRPRTRHPFVTGTGTGHPPWRRSGADAAASGADHARSPREARAGPRGPRPRADRLPIAAVTVGLRVSAQPGPHRVQVDVEGHGLQGPPHRR
jgi:hypothetical protein